MHPALGRQKSERVAASHDEGGGLETCFLSRSRLLYLDGEPSALSPARVHPQHHLGPVLGIGPARPGVDLGHRVAIVVLATEERTEFEGPEPAVEVADDLFGFGPQRLVALLGHELEECFDVGQAFDE